MRLSDLKTGQSATILKVLGHGGFRRRIMEMGFVRGKKVEVVLNAPLRDPIVYKIMDYEVSLRRSEAHMVVVITNEEAEGLISEEYNGTREGDQLHEVIAQSSKRINVALVGNPNSGKTSLFNAISGGHEHVGNYSGVTVDAKRGHCTYRGYRFEITDLPGHLRTHGLLARGTLRTPPFGGTYAGRNYQCRRSFEPGTQPLPHYRTHRPESPSGRSAQYVRRAGSEPAPNSTTTVWDECWVCRWCRSSPVMDGVSKPCWTR